MSMGLALRLRLIQLPLTLRDRVSLSDPEET